jgi:hypothetical protein
VRGAIQTNTWQNIKTVRIIMETMTGGTHTSLRKDEEVNEKEDREGHWNQLEFLWVEY